MEQMKIEWVDPKTLKPYPLNPDIRHNPTSSQYQELKRSIIEVGVSQPALVSEGPGRLNNVVVDGNRRRDVCLELGLKLPIIKKPFKSQKEMDNLFRQLNQNTYKLDSRQEVSIYLRGGEVTHKTMSAIKAIEAIAGREAIEAIEDKGTSPISYASSLSMIRKYTDINRPEFLKKAMSWMLETESAFRLKHAINNDTPKKVLIEAINKNKHLEKGHYTIKKES